VSVNCTSLIAGASAAVGSTTSILELGMGDDGILANIFWVPDAAVGVSTVTTDDLGAAVVAEVVDVTFGTVDRNGAVGKVEAWQGFGVGVHSMEMLQQPS
jgi:hypothetical protein